MPDPFPMPPATRVEPIDEVFHGEHVPDPYRWLEDGGSDEVQQWTEAQNAYTKALLDAVTGRDAIRAQLAELLALGMVSVPEPRRGRYFFLRREGALNQPVLYIRHGVESADRPLVDPNALSAAGTVALDWWFPSRDGRLLAFGLSEDGSEHSTLYVLDVDSGSRRSDVIPHTRFTSLAWLPDGSAFYYTRLPAPGDVPFGEEHYHRKVYLHRLGADPMDDLLVWSERRDMREEPSVDLSEDGRWLLLTVSLGWDQSDVYVRDLDRLESGWITIVEDEPALAWGEIYRETLYLFTNQGAPRYRVVAVPLADPRRDGWREIVPERLSATLEGGRVAGGVLALQYLINATSRIELRTLSGELIRELPLPGLGTVTGLGGERDGAELYFDFTSFTVPATIFRFDLGTERLSEWATIAAPLMPGPITVEQVWFDSTDEARVSMFVVRRSDVHLDGCAPMLLSGYGGFNISRTPGFAAGVAFWLARGGVFALPNLRGGGEYGEGWHRAGMLEQKQHTFDDFFAAAQFLIERGYTNPDRLAILGGSNGGLLVGAAITQQPHLFRAAVCQVPLLDMLRYHRFLIARLWTAEYGSAEDAEQYRWLRAYSPYHHVRTGVGYPAVLFTTAISDGRVDPLHARKMTALLQARQTAPQRERPILLRVETHAGHGQGKPIAKLLDELTDVWSFLVWQLHVAVQSPHAGARLTEKGSNR